MFLSGQSRIIKNPKKHRDSKSVFGEKKQRSRFDILGRKKQSAARTTGKAEQFNKRQSTLWQEYWGQKKSNTFTDDTTNNNVHDNAEYNSLEMDSRKRKRQNDDSAPQEKRVRFTGLSSVTYDDSKLTKLQQIISRDKEVKRAKNILRHETADEIDQVDALFDEQSKLFFSQKPIVRPNPMEVEKTKAYDRLVRDLVEDSRIVPARVKNLTHTELEIAREKFKEEEQERIMKFENGEEFSSEEDEDEMESQNEKEENNSEEGEFLEEYDGEYSEDFDDEDVEDDSVIPKNTLKEDIDEGEDKYSEDASDYNESENVDTSEQAEGSEISNVDSDEENLNTPSNSSLNHRAEESTQNIDSPHNEDEEEIYDSDNENNNLFAPKENGENKINDSNMDDDDDDDFEDDAEEELSEDEIEMMRLQEESLINESSMVDNNDEEAEEENVINAITEDSEKEDFTNGIADMGDFAEIEDPHAEAEEATLNNEFIQTYLLEGKNKLLRKLSSVCTQTFAVHRVEEPAMRMVELLRHISLSKNPDLSLIRAVIENLSQYGKLKPKKLLSALKDDLQIMYGKIDPSSGFPTPADLMISKAILCLYSTEKSQDLTQLLLIYFCKNLSECEIISHYDLVCALYICDMCLNYYDGFLPEVSNFLFNLTSLINADYKKRSQRDLNSSDMSEDFISTRITPSHPRIPPLKTFREDWLFVSKKESKPYKEEIIPELSLSSNIFSQQNAGSPKWRISFHVTLASLLRLSINKHKDLPSFSEIYEPLLDIFARMKVNHRYTLKQYREIATELQDLADTNVKNRFPLTYLRDSVKPFIDYEPKFQVDGFRGQYTGDENEQSKKILQSKVKRMRRQAVRELRADNEFLRHVRNVEQNRKNYDAKLKYKEAISHLERERADPVQYDFSIAEREKKISEIRKNQRKNKTSRHGKV